MRPRRLPAFTLIELLIVVAIIAILSAIAVPNFLEAQTRSKVSRTQADMLPGGPVSGLPSPIAYITSLPSDPFGAVLGVDHVDIPYRWLYDATNGTVSDGNIVRSGP